LKRHQKIDFDRVLIDWADEFIQDLVASFSARRPTVALRIVVAGLYMFAALHLIYAAVLPFYRGAMAQVIGVGTSQTPAVELTALATGIIVGGVSFHLLLMVAYVLLSFVVRASRWWTRLAGTAVLAVNFVVALNGLNVPDLGNDTLSVLHWISLLFAGAILTLLWIPAIAPAAATTGIPAANRGVQ
jgi:hypothetical protein